MSTENNHFLEPCNESFVKCVTMDANMEYKNLQ